MIGFRKLFAWLLCFGLCAAVALKTVWLGTGVDIPPGVVEVLKWSTAFFFGFNTLEKLTDKYTMTPKGLVESEPKP
jgi:hypothetical protein